MPNKTVRQIVTRRVSKQSWWTGFNNGSHASTRRNETFHGTVCTVVLFSSRHSQRLYLARHEKWHDLRINCTHARLYRGVCVSLSLTLWRKFYQINKWSGHRARSRYRWNNVLYTIAPLVSTRERAIENDLDDFYAGEGASFFFTLDLSSPVSRKILCAKTGGVNCTYVYIYIYIYYL